MKKISFTIVHLSLCFLFSVQVQAKTSQQFYSSLEEVGKDLELNEESDPIINYIDAKFYEYMLLDTSTEEQDINRQILRAKSSREFDKGRIKKLEKIQAKLERTRLEILARKSQAFRRSSQSDQGNAHVQYELAKDLAQKGDLAEAHKVLRLAFSLEKNNADFYVLSGKIYSLEKKSLLALNAFAAALKITHDHEEALRLSVREYLLAKNFDQAIQICLQWSRVLPFDKTPYFNLSTIYTVFKKQPEKGIYYLKKILDIDPDDARALENLARLYSENKNDVKTVEYLKKWALVEPGNLDVQYRLGLMYLRNKDYRKSLSYFKRILSHMPDHQQVLYYTGLIYELKDQKKKAIEYFEKVTRVSELSQDALLRRMLLLVDTGQEDKAIKELKNLITKNEEASFFDVLAAIYTRKKNYDHALKLLNKALKKFPGDERLIFSKGVLLDKMQRVEDSLLEMEGLIKLNPQHALALNYIGYSLADRNKDLPRALKLILKANELRPNDGYVLDSVGWIYYKLGQYDKALKYLSLALEKTPDEYVLLEHLGLIYRQLNQEKKSRQYFRESVEVLKKKKDLDWRESEDLQRIQNYLH